MIEDPTVGELVEMGKTEKIIIERTDFEKNTWNFHPTFTPILKQYAGTYDCLVIGVGEAITAYMNDSSPHDQNKMMHLVLFMFCSFPPTKKRMQHEMIEHKEDHILDFLKEDSGPVWGKIPHKGNMGK